MRMQKVRIIDLVEYSKQDDVDWGKDEGSFVGTKEQDSDSTNDDDNEDF